MSSFKSLVFAYCIFRPLVGLEELLKFRQPFGVQMCSSLCLNLGECHSLTFDKEQLCCIPGNTSLLSAGILEVASKELNTFTWHRKLRTRKKTIVIIQEHLKSKKGDINDYLHLNDGSTHMYVKRHGERKTWDEAAHVCEAEGGTLVKVDSRRKQTLLTKAFYDGHGGVSDYLWIGLGDTFDNTTWTWGDGTLTRHYSNWGFKQPDKSYNGAAENCVAMYSLSNIGAKWYDKPCKFHFRFVCERFHG